MKMEEVDRLLDAGFTADEIRGMLSGEPDPEPEVVPEPAEPHADPEFHRSLEALTQTIADLKQTIVANSARMTEIPAPKELTAKDALAAIINPRTNEEVK